MDKLKKLNLILLILLSLNILFTVSNHYIFEADNKSIANNLVNTYEEEIKYFNFIEVEVLDIFLNRLNNIDLGDTLEDIDNKLGNNLDNEFEIFKDQDNNIIYLNTPAILKEEYMMEHVIELDNNGVVSNLKTLIINNDAGERIFNEMKNKLENENGSYKSYVKTLKKDNNKEYITSYEWINYGDRYEVINLKLIPLTNGLVSVEKEERLVEVLK